MLYIMHILHIKSYKIVEAIRDMSYTYIHLYKTPANTLNRSNR